MTPIVSIIIVRVIVHLVDDTEESGVQLVQVLYRVISVLAYVTFAAVAIATYQKL